MQVTIISYRVNSVIEVPVTFHIIEKPDEDGFIGQLKEIRKVNGYDVKESLVNTLRDGVPNYEKNHIAFPRLGLKYHASQLINDPRCGKVVKTTPIDLGFWLDD